MTFKVSQVGENVYEDTDFVREVLNSSSRLSQLETLSASRTEENGLKRATTTADSPNQNHSPNQPHVQVDDVNREKGHKL